MRNFHDKKRLTEKAKGSERATAAGARASIIKAMRRVVIALAVVSALWGQAPKKKTSPKKAVVKEEPAAVRFPIESIRVTGSKLYAEADIVKLLGLKVGDPIDEKAFDEAQRRLLEHGAFSGVSYLYQPAPGGKGYVVSFEVSDAEQVLPFRFDERLQIDEAAVRKKLASLDPLFRDRIPGVDAVMERYRRAVEEFGGVPVQAKVASDGPDELFVLFYPKGAPPVVAGTFFQGNQVIPAAELQNTLNGVAVGVEYRERRFRELLDTQIRPLYEARGRLGVQFPKIETVADPAVKGLRVTVTVEEGPSYSFGEIAVSGTGSLDEELARASGLKSGEVANMAAAAAAQERVHALLRRQGHMNVSSKIERRVDEDKRVVDVTFVVTPGARYTFGKLFLKGLDIHGEHAVRRMWNMKPEQPFNAEYPEYFLNRLREDGVFDNLQSARAELKPDHRALTVDVTLIFNEKRPEVLKPRR
jgi:outer membrane protein insertion porin family